MRDDDTILSEPLLPSHPKLPDREGQVAELFQSPMAREVVDKVFGNPGKYGFSSVDEAAEAVLRYGGRLLSILRKSMEIGGKREAYIDKSLRFIAKSVQRVNRKREAMDNIVACNSVAETPDFMTEVLAEGEVELPLDMDTRRFIGDISPACFIPTMGAQYKRLLFLTIKCAWEINDELARKVARRLGLPPLWLETVLHKARATLEPQRLSLEKLNRRINEAWARILCIEAELKNDASPGSRELFSRRIREQQARYYKLLERRARLRLLVTHKAIAGILGLPKGSIDSGIFYLKAGRGCKTSVQS